MGFGFIASVIAKAQSGIQSKFTARSFGDNVYRATFGIAPKKGALRSFKHFDVLNIIKRCSQTLRAPHIHTVHINADALIARWLVAVGQNTHAAHVNDKRARTRKERGDAQRRNGAIAQIKQRLYVAIFNTLTTQNRDRDRHILQIFRSFLGGHDNFGQASIIFINSFFCHCRVS